MSQLKLAKVIKNSCSTHEKSQYWSPNNLLLPSQVSVWSQEKVLWNCPTCFHEFSSTPEHVCKRNQWCSFCSGDALCDSDDCDFCEKKSFRSHPKSIYWSALNLVSPRQVILKSNVYYWFDCNICGHSFDYCLNAVCAGMWCKFCNGLSLCGIAECVTCTPKSFGSHPMSLQWDECNGISPYCVALQCNKKFWFKCASCKHMFDCELGHIVNEGNGCPFCNSCKLCDDNKCMMCFNRSFASSPFCFMWSIKNSVTPRQVCIKSSNVKRWFYCSICKHDFIRSLSNINHNASGICIYCVKQSNVLCDNENCNSCYNRSFISHEKVVHWSPNNKKLPRFIFKYSQIKHIFVCNECGNEFLMSPYNVCKNQWCSCIRNKTERKFHKILLDIFDANQIITQFKQEWCKNKRKLPYDFCLTHLNIIIEIDGIQHFEQVCNWTNPNETYNRDIYKERCANENGYSIIRILQEDVWKDKYDWKTELLQNIEKIKSEKIVQNIFMCKKNEYEIFRNSMIQKLQEHPQIEILDETA